MVIGYRRFLDGLIDELVDAMMDCENHQWHHLGPEAPEFQHYNRVVGWLDLITERRKYYDAERTRRAWKTIRTSSP